MKKTQLKHGFELLERREIKEIKVVAHQYRHQKSGAELLHLECDDANKVFNIAFKTIPEDNTGCPHIIEHSVLNGSRNYPAKNTFMELVKGSLNTFINAMTSSDWTSYPVASTNDKDFFNLMKVYLDAVLFPKIHEDSRILDQEGWHYELFSEDQELKYRGVVYNEMKGAFSSVDSIVSRYCTHAQFPDTPYCYESGGDPEAIPELSNDKFLAFHNKYYHPSNSKIALYGNLDIDEALKIIDEMYLNQFDDPGVRHEFPLQKPFAKPKKINYEYPLGDDLDPQGQHYLAMNFSYGKVTDNHLVAKFQLLADLLMRSPASPLKTVIRNSGLCQDSQIHLNEDILQPTLSLVFKQVKEENLEALSKLVREELQRIVKEGFDKKLIEACINAKEFFLREAQMQRFPKGLFYVLGSLGLWNHGGDPLSYMAFEGYLEDLRRGLSEPYFEDLVKDIFLRNKHMSEIHFIPVPGLIARQEDATNKKLAAYKASLSPAEIQELIKRSKELQDWQESMDSEEDLLKIPLLKLSDVNPVAPENPTIKEAFKEFTLLKHPVNTNGIVYFRQYFDLAHATQDDLPWIMVYTQLLGLVNSENYSYGDLANEILTHTGGIQLSLDVMNSYQTPDDIIPKLILSGKAVHSKIDALMELSAEFALKARFDDPARIKGLIRELKARAEAMTIQGGVNIAIRRMFAPFSQSHNWQDRISGLAYYHFLVELESRLEVEIDDIMEELKWVQGHFMNVPKSIISITANEELIPDVISALPALLNDMPKESYEPAEISWETRNQNEGISAPVKIQYVVKGGNFFRKGYPYSGKLRVLSGILSNEYLYRELRVKGGAYGGGSGFTLDGYQYFYSYRDPNMKESLAVYDGVPDFIRSFQCSNREMDKFILGDISNLDYPKTPESQGIQGDMDYLTGFTQADRQQIRDEVLDTKLEDLKQYADMIQAIMAKNHYAIFGNEAEIQKNADIFDLITPVFRK
ncbi:MAG: insulinase family protein [Candidatus Cloacimonetes bacterium]|nr:insulinase family protein [Candidatus Cloacimonadota bacterium]